MIPNEASHQPGWAPAQLQTYRADSFPASLLGFVLCALMLACGFLAAGLRYETPASAPTPTPEPGPVVTPRCPNVTPRCPNGGGNCRPAQPYRDDPGQATPNRGASSQR